MILKNPEKTIPLPRVRATKLLRIMLGIQGLFVTGISLAEEGLVLDVRPTKKSLRCGDCGERSEECGTPRSRVWRHLDLGGMKALLRYSTSAARCRLASGY